jgi:SAM-dependent methyltransferase
MIHDLILTLKRIHTAIERKRLISSYIKNGRKPWSEGYSLYKEDFIRTALQNENVIRTYAENRQLPKEYGKYLDERVIEYPWLFSQLGNDGRTLDAGSTLNYNYLLAILKKRNKEITISTLEPEPNCLWTERISYIFCDLREIPFRDDWFDEIASISVIEHMGMDNSLYSSNPQYREKNTLDFLKAISEYKRVTKSGGRVYITVPYGRYIDYGWYQQFDADMVNRLIDQFNPFHVDESYYCYENNGWALCPKEHCKYFEGFDVHKTKYFDKDSDKDYDPDLAASSRAVAALILQK